MSDDERRAFLQRGTRTGKLATVRADGRPHIAPIWFVLDGDVIVFHTGASTVKGRNIQRDPRVTLCIDNARPPYAFVVIEGTAKIDADMGESLTWATRIGGRYMGAGRAEEFGKRNAVDGELLVRVTPTRMIAETGISD
jgi:hypothetical protein